MILAIFLFTLMDASVKAVAPDVGILPALWVRYAGQMFLVLIIVMPRLRAVARARHPVLQLLRSVLLMGATAFYFAGISRIPLTDAAALMAINPVLVTLGAAMFLGEALGIRRLSGIAVALIGAMVVIRPGSDVFAPAALFPLAAAACYSGYALLTRKVGADEDAWTSLFYTGLVGTIALSLIIPFHWRTPGGFTLMLMAGIAVFGTVGQMFLIRAFSQGEAAMLAPFSYVGLIFSAIWGMAFFAEWPDMWTVFGALVIAGAGLYVWHRETFRRK